MKQIKTAIITFGILLVSFLLCRYALFNIHGMKQFPLLLLFFGILVIIISASFKSKTVMLFTALGYPISFIIGYVFQKDTLDPRGASTNNMWYIWMLTFVASVFIGVVVEIVKLRKAKM